MPVMRWFRMPCLAKPEYDLGKALAEKYGLLQLDGKPNWTELVAVALKLMYEVTMYHSDSDKRGEQWIVNVINEYKKVPTTQRVYTMLTDDK